MTLYTIRVEGLAFEPAAKGKPPCHDKVYLPSASVPASLTTSAKTPGTLDPTSYLLDLGFGYRAPPTRKPNPKPETKHT